MNTVCRLAWVCLLLWLSAAPCGAAAPAAPTPSPLADADIRTLLRDWIDCDKLQVGMVVGLVDNTGTRVISYGKLGNGTAQEVDGDTLFCLGSVTKVFTALLLQDLVEQGKLRLSFVRQPGGPTTAVLVYLNGTRLRGSRIADTPLDCPR